MRADTKNLPPVGKRMIWATTEGSFDGKTFHQFFGEITADGKYIDYGYGRYKLTSNYWWTELKNPKSE